MVEQVSIDGIVKKLLSPLNVLITEKDHGEASFHIGELAMEGDVITVIRSVKEGGNFNILEKPITAVMILKAILVQKRLLKS